MKVYTKVTFVWDKAKGEYVEESSEFYEYEGEVAQAKGGGQETQTQTNDPWSGQQPYLTDLFQQAQTYQQQGAPDTSASTGFTEQSLADLGLARTQLGQTSDAIQQAQGLSQQAIGDTQTAQQQTGQIAGQVGGLQGDLSSISGQIGTDAQTMRDVGQTIQGYAPGIGTAAQGTQAAMTPYLQSIMQSNQQLGSGALLDPASNPAMMPYMQAMNDQIMKQYQEQIMPGLTSGAVQAGGIGSSRQGIAQGRAADAALEAVGRNTQGFLSQAYGQGLQGTLQAQGLAPSLMQQGTQLGMLPAEAARLQAQLQGQAGGIYGQAAGLGGLQADVTGLQGSLLEREAGLRGQEAEYGDIAARQSMRGIDLAQLPAQMTETQARLAQQMAQGQRGLETQADQDELARLQAYQALIGGNYGGTTTSTGPGTQGPGMGTIAGGIIGGIYGGGAGGAAAGASIGSMFD